MALALFACGLSAVLKGVYRTDQLPSSSIAAVREVAPGHLDQQWPPPPILRSCKRSYPGTFFPSFTHICIGFRYESEEDDFLREIESIKCVDTDTTDDYQEDGPVLGVLCSLVSEIGELRKENRKLKHRLEAVPDRPRGMAHRVGALLDGSRQKILPRFISKRTPGSEIRTGARERLSSPPNKVGESHYSLCVTILFYCAGFFTDSWETTKMVMSQYVAKLKQTRAEGVAVKKHKPFIIVRKFIASSRLFICQQ
uniref:BEN domain-containing protein n=1 Tax=Steinernema glaseri TaxID=37863 RepID=A0A1I8AB72_9BILA